MCILQAAGEAEYVNDIPKYKQELCGSMVLSSVGNATIDSIDPSPALVSSPFHLSFSLILESVCLCLHTHAHIHTHAPTHACMHARTHTTPHTCMHVHTHTHTHIHTHTYMMHKHMYTCIRDLEL